MCILLDTIGMFQWANIYEFKKHGTKPLTGGQVIVDLLSPAVSDKDHMSDFI